MFLAKIWIFDENLDFWPKFGFLTKLWIFDQNLDFWPNFGSLIKIWIFDNNFYRNFDFDEINRKLIPWQKISFFLQKYRTKIKFYHGYFKLCLHNVTNIRNWAMIVTSDRPISFKLNIKTAFWLDVAVIHTRAASSRLIQINRAHQRTIPTAFATVIARNNANW